MRSIVTLCLWCVHYAVCSEVYTAAVVGGRAGQLNDYGAMSRQARDAGADILVIPTQDAEGETCAKCVDNYDDALKAMSTAAKQGNIYIAANLYENINCQGEKQLARNHVVFGNDGALIMIHRKSVYKSNCNETQSNMASFTTEFGIKFGILREEDIIQQNIKDTSIRNFIILRPWASTTLMLSEKHYSPMWAFATRSNVISSNGIYGSNVNTRSGNIMVGELNKNGNENHHITSHAAQLSTFPGENLSEHVIKPLDLFRSQAGYQDTVCHASFCCEFDVKTTVNGNIDRALTYGLIAYDGLRDPSPGHAIRSQTCAVLACAGLYKRSCFTQSDNISVTFDKIVISGNFSADTEQYPSLITSSESTKHVIFEKSSGEHNNVIIEIRNTDNLLRFGILGREFGKVPHEVRSFDSEYVNNENVTEFFDYLWIRLRILIFVVSIYILEMM